MQKLSIAELAAQSVELLPGRETLLADLNFAGIFASNSSLAANVLTVCSSANSTALQGIVVAQS